MHRSTLYDDDDDHDDDNDANDNDADDGVLTEGKGWEKRLGDGRLLMVLEWLLDRLTEPEPEPDPPKLCWWRWPPASFPA